MDMDDPYGIRTRGRFVRHSWNPGVEYVLTLRYTGGGHNGHPQGIYALVPSRLIWGTSDFGTIPIW